MSFINKAVVDVRRPLVEARFPFKRSSDLKDALEACVIDYYTKASIGRRFEARGVLVIGESRQGKSTEIEMMLEAFNDEAEIMPNGRPGKIISCLLSGKVTWKDLGTVILEVLGYPLRGRNSQTEIWSKVRKYAELQGVIGIHFDECQHVFSDANSTTNRIILDSFKSLLKDHDWPLMLIFFRGPEPCDLHCAGGTNQLSTGGGELRRNRLVEIRRQRGVTSPVLQLWGQGRSAGRRPCD
jgi:hypothetical protein